MRQARKKLSGIFPDLRWDGLEWACWKVDRAEPNAASRLPDGPALLERGTTALAWPTKLVYAPALADQALEFTARHLTPGEMATDPIPLPLAGMGHYPWETEEWRSLPS